MKPVLLLLPGLMCDAAVWAPQVAHLSEHAQCVVADYGLRDSLEAMARQVLASTDAPRFAMAGHSMGGHGALVLALRHPGLYGSVSAFSPIVSLNTPPMVATSLAPVIVTVIA